MKEIIANGSILSSEILFKHGKVVLCPEILDLAKQKIDDNTNKKRQRKLVCMKKITSVNMSMYSFYKNILHLLMRQLID